MTLGSLALFAAVYFAAVATPGPGLAALVARVLAYGLAGVAPFIAGYVVGDMIWLLVAGTGLAALANAFAGAFTVIKYAGAAYLLFLAWRTATAPATRGEAPPPASCGFRAFFGSLSLTLGNPKVMVFFLSIMPLVVDVKSSYCHDPRDARRDLRSDHRDDARGLRARRQPRPGALPLGEGDALRPPRRGRRDGGRRGRDRGEVGAMSDLLAIGEPLVELEQAGDGAPFVQGFSGDASNAMIAAARLGADAAIFTAVGADRFGRALTELWLKEGVDASRVVVSGGAHTGLIFLSRGPDGAEISALRAGSAASRIGESDLPVDRIKATRILHVTGASQAISSSAADAVFAAIDIAREAKNLVSYAANVSPKLWPLRRARAIVHEAMRASDIVLIGLDDARDLMGSDEPDAIADFYLRLGARLVVVKLGRAGAFAANAARRERVAPFAVEPVDATGASDAFDGALLAEFVCSADPFAAARFASVAARLSTMGRGAIAPLPRRAEVEAAMASNR